MVPIDFEKSYSNTDSEVLRKGVRAMSMDEKWDIFFDKNTLSFHRSWTGRGIFKIEFLEQENELIVERAFVEENFSNQQGNDYCSSLLNWIIEVVIFRRRTEHPKVKS